MGFDILFRVILICFLFWICVLLVTCRSLYVERKEFPSEEYMDAVASAYGELYNDRIKNT